MAEPTAPTGPARSQIGLDGGAVALARSGMTIAVPPGYRNTGLRRIYDYLGNLLEGLLAVQLSSAFSVRVEPETNSLIRRLFIDVAAPVTTVGATGTLTPNGPVQIYKLAGDVNVTNPVGIAEGARMVLLFEQTGSGNYSINFTGDYSFPVHLPSGVAYDGVAHGSATGEVDLLEFIRLREEYVCVDHLLY